MSDDIRRMNKDDKLKIICSMSGLNPRDLKTKIDIYSRNSSGKKIVICKKFYSMEDVVHDPENGLLYDAIVKAIIRACNIPSSDIINFAYPDQETLEHNTLCIEITNYIEKDGQQNIIDNNERP